MAVRQPPRERGALGLAELIFGLCCDGPTWPETVDGSLSNVGSAIVGPLGLLAALEVTLGLRRPAVPSVRRIACMRAKLKAADTGNRCWSRSFEADPWSTARLLLKWRDELVETSWSPVDDQSLSKRLRDVCAAEAAGPSLPPGFADRCCIVLNALSQIPALPWNSLILVEPRETLTGGVRRMITAVEACGVAVIEKASINPVQGDLGKLQRLLGGHAAEPLIGDGSVIVVHADTEAMAAEAMGDWMRSGGAENNGAVFVLGSSSRLLDDVFGRRGLPRFGFSNVSPARAALQVMRLAFSTRWAPFDPFNLMELLLLPGGPIPPEVARTLTRVLAETPGRDGPAWNEALEECTAKRRARFQEAGLEGADLERRLRADTDSWQTWVLASMHNSEVGMPVKDVLQICSGVAAWAARGGDEDPLRMRAAGAAADLAAAAVELGEPFIYRRLLSRMVDEAIGPGMADPALQAEAAPWSSVHSPGAVWAEAGMVVWWAPSGTPAAKSGPWTMAEVETLAACGCLIAERTAAMAAAAHSWRQPILNARRRIVLALPSTMGGDTGDDHPLMHELRPLLDRAPPGVIFRAEELLSGSREIGGRYCERQPLLGRLLPGPARTWEVTPNLLVRPGTASATSIELMLGCRFSWVAEHVGRLRPGARASIPTGHRLIGLLAHAVARDIFKPGAPLTSAEALARAATVLEGLLATEAAPLLLPGNAADLARARTSIPRALEYLAERLTQAGLNIIGTEVPVPANSGVLETTELKGRVDMLLETKAGARVIVDMKWTGRDRYRREELREGRAVQLATYTRLQPTNLSSTAAYFMLAQSRFLAADVWPFPGAQISGSDLVETWREVALGWEAAWNNIVGGVVDATGVGDDPVDHPCAVVLEAPCKFCTSGRLCGWRAVA
jgi:ATP-dependent helicase/nuclease subunit B